LDKPFLKLENLNPPFPIEAIIYFYYSLEIELQSIVLKTVEYYDIQPSNLCNQIQNMACPKELECKNELIIYRCKNIHFTISKFTKQFSKRGMGNTMGHSTDLFTEPPCGS